MKKYLALVMIAVVPLAAHSSTCKVGVAAAPIGFWTWMPESTIKVYVLPSDFTERELGSLLEPFAAWNAVSEVTNSKVRFEYKGTTATPLYCQSCLTIVRGEVFDKTKRHVTELRTYSAGRNQIMTWANIVVDPRLTNPKALSNAVTHELGHSFGLLDCYSCRKNSTVMGQFDAVNAANEIVGPSPCDVMQVRAVYQTVSAKLKRAKPITVDEGEEPIDDDTPIIVPKP